MAPHTILLLSKLKLFSFCMFNFPSPGCIFLPGDGAVSGEAAGAAAVRAAAVPGGGEDSAGGGHRLHWRPPPFCGGDPRTGGVYQFPGVSGNGKSPGYDAVIKSGRFKGIGK